MPGEKWGDAEWDALDSQLGDMDASIRRTQEQYKDVLFQPEWITHASLCTVLGMAILNLRREVKELKKRPPPYSGGFTS